MVRKLWYQERIRKYNWLSQWLNCKESVCDSGATCCIPGSGRCPGGGHGNPLRYSCLENPMDTLAWQAMVHRVAKSWTQLKLCTVWCPAKERVKNGFPTCQTGKLHDTQDRVLMSPGPSTKFSKKDSKVSSFSIQTNLVIEQTSSRLQFSPVQFSSVIQSFPTLWDPMNWSTLGCPSPTPGVYSNSYPSSRWCHPAISSCVTPFSSCPQSFPASGSFPMSQLFAWGSQSIGVSASASVLPMNTQDWSPLGWTSRISLQSKGLSRVFSNTTV